MYSLFRKTGPPYGYPGVKLFTYKQPLSFSYRGIKVASGVKLPTSQLFIASKLNTSRPPSIFQIGFSLFGSTYRTASCLSSRYFTTRSFRYFKSMPDNPIFSHIPLLFSITSHFSPWLISLTERVFLTYTYILLYSAQSSRIKLILIVFFMPITSPLF